MSSNIVEMKSVQLPAAYADFFDVDSIGDDLSSGVTGGFAVVSIRGSKWRIKHGGEETPVVDDNDDPVAALEVVLLKASPEVSRIYYEKAYEEGDAVEPDCYSANGIAPDPASPKKQSDTCAACPHAVWGSKITPAGKKAKACQDNRRVAVVPAGDIENDIYGGAMLLRVPAASLADLATYGRGLKGKGFPYNTVVTKLGFDVAASYPKLTFKPVRRLTNEELGTAAEHFGSDTLQSILSSTPMPAAEPAPPVVNTPAVDLEFEEDEPAPAPVKPAKSKPKATAKKKKTASEARIAEVSAAAIAAADAVPDEPAGDALDDELGDILSDLDSLS